MNSPPAGTCRERLSFPWPRRTVTGPSRCKITRWVPAAAKDSRYGLSCCTDRYCLSHPSPALVRSGVTHGCRRMPLVSRSPSSLDTDRSSADQCTLPVTYAAQRNQPSRAWNRRCAGSALPEGLTHVDARFTDNRDQRLKDRFTLTSAWLPEDVAGPGQA